MRKKIFKQPRASVFVFLRPNRDGLREAINIEFASRNFSLLFIHKCLFVPQINRVNAATLGATCVRSGGCEARTNKEMVRRGGKRN